MVPSFSGGSGMIGSAGSRSSDITRSAVSGQSYVSPALTATTNYTLTVTGSDGTVATTGCSVTPTSVSVGEVSPADVTMAPGQQSFAASASGGLTNTVTWSASGGSFHGDVWTSPNTAGTYTITATSVDDSEVSVSTTATVSGPVVTVQPVSQNLCSGASATLAVAAEYAVGYQWNLNGSPIEGATGASYHIPAASAGDAGNYTAAVANPAGTTNSSTAKIVVGSSITSNPHNLSIFATQTGTFSVAATGQAPFTYQWYVIPPEGSSGAAIPGATSSTYTTPPVDGSYDGNKYYAAVTDACGGSVMTSTSGGLTVQVGNAPPTINTQPVGQAVTAGSTPSFTASASGTPPLTYQWYYVPGGSVAGTAIEGATSASYQLDAGATTTANDQDQYYLVVSNAYGQAVSQSATLAVGNGILIQITGEPGTAYVNDGAPATFSVSASSAVPLTYQWYRAEAGSAQFAPISGATDSTYTLPTTSSGDSGAVFYVMVSNGGVTGDVRSSSAALFVGTLDGIGDLCDSNWVAMGDAASLPGCSYQLTAASRNEHGQIVWPTLISTANLQLSFTLTVSNPSLPPADGFAMALGDPSLGATTSSEGETGEGLGARGIPGFVLGFDTYWNEADPWFGYPADPPVPYLGVGRGEDALWENPWFNVNTNIPALAFPGDSISHDYTISIVQAYMTVTMDGTQVFSGSVTVPPVAYLFVTASTGGSWEETDISNLSATVSTP